MATNDRWFDRVVMVDWSASSSPQRGRDSIWIASANPSGDDDVLLNPGTRAEAMAWLVDHLRSAADQRVLVGFDLSFGYPEGFAAALTGRAGAGWSDVWQWFAEHVIDSDRNRNNRFDVMAEVNAHLMRACGTAPFWGHVGGRPLETLPRTRPHTFEPFSEFRLVEQRLQTQGYRPFSAWQLAYAGSVGSQMVMGLAALERLRQHPDLTTRFRIWPFDIADRTSRFRPRDNDIVVAEVWPGLCTPHHDLHPVRDAAQVLTLVQHLLALDAAETLDHWFTRHWSDDEHHRVVHEEGWTLGCGEGISLRTGGAC